MQQQQERYWGLPRLSYGIRWLEELVGILSRPFLMIGFVISMFDLLTQGQMLSNPTVFYGWAIVQAVAVDASFFVTVSRSAKAFKVRKWGSFVGLSILALGLGFVAWAAMDIQSLQQALNLTNIQALHELGLNITLLTHIRSAVAIGLAGIIAWRGHEQEDLAPSTEPTKRRRRFKKPAWFGKIGEAVNQIAPVVENEPAPANQAPNFSEPGNLVANLIAFGNEPEPHSANLQTEPDRTAEPASEPERNSANPARTLNEPTLDKQAAMLRADAELAVYESPHPVTRPVLVDFRRDRSTLFETENTPQVEDTELTETRGQRIVQIPRVGEVEEGPNPAGKREAIKQVLISNRNATLQEIMEKALVSKGYASDMRKELLKELYGEQEVAV